MKKRKIILAVLASLCVSACAAGIVGCTNNKNKDTHDSAIYGIYLKYRENMESKGEDPKSYDEWLASLFGDSTDVEIGGKDGVDGTDGKDGVDGTDGKDGEDGVGIEDIQMVEIGGKQYFEFIMSNGRIIRIAVDGSDRQESTGFIIKAVDQNGDPVENAYFNIGYTEGYETVYLDKNGKSVSMSNISKAYAVKTNSKGIAAFYCFPDDSIKDKTLNAYIADPYSISSEGDKDGTPNGYVVSFGGEGSINTYSSFTKDGDYKYNATVNFILSNGWGARFDAENDLVYKRFMKDMGDESNNYQYRGDPTNPNDLTVTHVPYVQRVEKGRYNYFSFAPLSAPNNTDSASILDYNIAQARVAASGVYRFYLNTNNSSANVSMYLYSFTDGNYFQRNSDYSPADTLVLKHTGNIPDDGELQEIYKTHIRFGETGNYTTWLEEYKKTFSGTNYIDLEISSDMATATYCFGIISDANCSVTVTVERIGDAAKWEIRNETISIPNTAKDAPAIPDNKRVKDVPFNSTLVLGDDGYYHIGSAEGDIVYVQLKNATRVNENSMEYLAHYELSDATPEGGSGGTSYGSVFIYTTDSFDYDNNFGIHYIKDYSDVVLGYSALADANGLYPVTELLKTVLDEFCKDYDGWKNYPETYWLAACYFYGSQPDGSQENPYEVTLDIISGREQTSGSIEINLNSNGTTYVAYKPTVNGYFGFASKTNNANVNIEGGIEFSAQLYDANSDSYASYTFHYVKLTAYNEYVFPVAGTGSATIYVAKPAQTVEYSLQSAGDSQTEVNTESNPGTYRGSGVYLVNIDHVAHNAPLVINLRASIGGNGEYVVSIHGGTNPTVLKDNQTSIAGTITLSSSSIKLYIDDVEDGSFFINIVKVVNTTSAASDSPVAQAPAALEAKYGKH